MTTYIIRRSEGPTSRTQVGRAEAFADIEDVMRAYAALRRLGVIHLELDLIHDGADAFLSDGTILSADRAREETCA